MTADCKEKSPLRLLGDIISHSIDRIESQLAEASVNFPSINEPYDPTSKAEMALLNPAILHATSLIVAAATQLLATVRHPANTTIDDALAVSEHA